MPKIYNMSLSKRYSDLIMALSLYVCSCIFFLIAIVFLFLYGAFATHPPFRFLFSDLLLSDPFFFYIMVPISFFPAAFASYIASIRLGGKALVWIPWPAIAIFIIFMYFWYIGFEDRAHLFAVASIECLLICYLPTIWHYRHKLAKWAARRRKSQQLSTEKK